MSDAINEWFEQRAQLKRDNAALKKRVEELEQRALGENDRIYRARLGTMEAQLEVTRLKALLTRLVESRQAPVWFDHSAVDAGCFKPDKLAQAHMRLRDAAIDLIDRVEAGRTWHFVSLKTGLAAIERAEKGDGG